MSNTWVIYLIDGDNLPKGGLIPDKLTLSSENVRKGWGLPQGGLSLRDEPAAYQVVGRVTAYQAFDE